MRKFGASKIYLSFPVAYAAVVHLLFYVPTIVCVGSVLVFALLYVLSSFAIALMRKRELGALLLLSFGCLAIVNAL